MTIASKPIKACTVSDLLDQWLVRQVDQDGLQWLQKKRMQIAAGAPERVFFTSFSAVPRYAGKAALQLTAEDRLAAKAICFGWEPQQWRVDQAGRTLLLLSRPSSDLEAYQASLDQLFSAADVGELVALYQALPLLPHPERYRLRAAEGVRSNMTVVFNAIALHNPYPARYLDEAAWNQMVLKAVFVESPLHQIQGLDERANLALAQMLVDYAHERWAANRSVTPELWRPVGKFATEEMLPDLQRVFADSDPVQQEAAALACADSPFLDMHSLWSDGLKTGPEDHRSNLISVIQSGRFTWDTWTCDRVMQP